MNYKSKKFIVIIGVVLILVIVLGYKIYNKQDNNSNQPQISYDSTNEEINWDSLEQVTIDLNNKVSSNSSVNFNNDTITISKSGVYVLSGTYHGNIYIDGEKDTLVKLVLNGIDITSTDSPVINIEKAQTTLIYINENTINNLNDSSTYSNVIDDEPNGAIFSKDDLIIDGLGTLNLTANYQDGIVSKDTLKILNGNINIISNDDGIRGKDYITIKDGNIKVTAKSDGIKSTNNTTVDLGYIIIDGGNITIDSDKDAIQAETNLIINDGVLDITSGGGSTITSKSNEWGNWGNQNITDISAKGLKAGNDILINNGTLNLDTSDDSIHCNNDINISGGSILITSGDDGIHSDNELSLSNANIDISESYEGIESTTININSGTYTINTSDDGINASGGNDSSSMGARPGANSFTIASGKITINGGDIKIISTGDGIDSNGSVYINGGNTYVDGPTDNGNGALDYDSEFKVTSGNLIAVGSSGMMQTISSNSTVYSINIVYDSIQSANTELSIRDGNNKLLSYTPTKNYSSVVLVNSLLEKGNTYDIYSGNNKYTSITIANIINSIGNTNNAMGGKNPGRR